MKPLIELSKKMFDVAFLIADKHNIDLLTILKKDYDIDKQTLKELMCIKSKKGIDMYDICYNLEQLIIKENISTIDFTVNKFLTLLLCSKCNIESLTIENNPNLKYLYCGNNKIKHLKLPENLIELDCSDNLLTDIKLNKTLQILNISGNNISNLIVNDELIELQCMDTKIEMLDLTNTNIQQVHCLGSPIKEIHVKKE